jgi:hypothetical protein
MVFFVSIRVNSWFLILYSSVAGHTITAALDADGGWDAALAWGYTFPCMALELESELESA